MTSSHSQIFHKTKERRKSCPTYTCNSGPHLREDPENGILATGEARRLLKRTTLRPSIRALWELFWSTLPLRQGQGKGRRPKNVGIFENIVSERSRTATVCHEILFSETGCGGSLRRCEVQSKRRPLVSILESGSGERAWNSVSEKVQRGVIDADNPKAPKWSKRDVLRSHCSKNAEKQKSSVA